MTDRNKFWQAFSEIDDCLKKSEFPIVELRPKSREKKHALTGDYDYLICSRFTSTLIKEILLICRKQGVSFIIQNPKINKVKIAIISDGGEKIEYEFWEKLQANFRSKILGREIRLGFSYPQYLKITNKIGVAYTLSLFYIMHLYLKKKNHDQAVDERLEYFESLMNKEKVNNSETVMGQNIVKIKEKIFGIICRLKERGSNLNDANEEAMKTVFKLVRIHELISAKHIFEGVQKKINANSNKYNEKIIPVVGPDGSGKTTLIEYMKKRWPQKYRSYKFKNLFRQNKLYGVSRRLFKKENIDNNIYDEQNASFVSFLTILRLFKLSNDLEKESAKILIDRWIIEFMVRGYRVRMEKCKPILIYNVILKLITTPSNMIVMMADRDSIIERKMVEDFVALDFYNRYIDFIMLKKIPFVYVLYSGRDSDSTYKALEGRF